MLSHSRRFGSQVAYVLGGGASGPVRPGESRTMGNGRAISLQLAAEGATVAIADRDRERAIETVESITASGGSAYPVLVDARDPDSCRRGVAEVVDRSGRLDVVVANVGVHGNLRIRQQTVEDWDRSVDINARSHWVTAQAALDPMLAAGRGVFVFVASSAGVRSSGTSLAYEASKAAQLAIMRAIAVRYGADGIRANALVLGVIDTGMARELFDDNAEAIAQREGIAPVGRQGQPEEVALAAAFLASADASYITGVELAVDGGLSALSPSRRPRLAPSPRPTHTNDNTEDA